MKIAVVVSTFPPYKGGMGNVAQAHAGALKRAGHEVTMLAPGAGLRPLFRIGNAAVVPQLLWKLRGFDVVEMHYPFYGGAEWVLLWKKLFGKKTRLVTLYHMDSVGTGLLGAIFRVYRALFLWAVVRASDRLIVTSTDYAASSAVRGAKRLVEVPLSVDTRACMPGGTGHGAVFVGALDDAHYFKGLDVLLRALATLKSGRLVVVGDGNLRPSYEAQAKTLGIADRVTFLGKVPDEKLAETYRQASFHVLPSVDRSEAFGLVTLEAAASGIPSIVSDLPGVRSVVVAGETGFIVPPTDVSALAEAMTKLFGDPALAARMGAAARKRVEQKYASDVVDRLVVKAVVE